MLQNYTFIGNTLEDWLIALAIAVGSIIVSKLFYLISTKGIKRIFEKAKNRFMYITTDMLEEPIAVIIVIAGFYNAERHLTFPTGIDAKVDKVLLFAMILVLTWMVARLLNDLITEYIVPLTEKSDSKLDDQLLPILRKVLSIVVWVLGIVIALDNVGYNVGTIIAGLGIGGLAFAFAAQETIANFFGGVTVFVDSPFVIDDRIKILNFDGWVREVGLRTTKLETLDGRRLTNAELDVLEKRHRECQLRTRHPRRRNRRTRVQPEIGCHRKSDRHSQGDACRRYRSHRKVDRLVPEIRRILLGPLRRPVDQKRRRLCRHRLAREPRNRQVAREGEDRILPSHERRHPVEIISVSEINEKPAIRQSPEGTGGNAGFFISTRSVRKIGKPGRLPAEYAIVKP